jgi:hypothetical protein
MHLDNQFFLQLCETNILYKLIIWLLKCGRLLFLQLNVKHVMYFEICKNYTTVSLLVTVNGWYRAKRPIQLRQFYDLLCSPSEF